MPRPRSPTWPLRRTPLFLVIPWRREELPADAVILPVSQGRPGPRCAAYTSDQYSTLRAYWHCGNRPLPGHEFCWVHARMW